MLIFRNQEHNFEHNRLVLGIMLKSIIGNSKSIVGSDLTAAIYLATPMYILAIVLSLNRLD